MKKRRIVYMSERGASGQKTKGEVATQRVLKLRLVYATNYLSAQTDPAVVL
jgi:hypothetical protein